MNWKEEIPEVFTTPVKCLEDYCKRIDKIGWFLSASGVEGLKAYYRGDRAEDNVQCSLFRKNRLSEEAALFENWKKTEDKDLLCEDEFENLVRMQHEGHPTRLLDFTTDPLVALRFACGTEEQNFAKKVTVFATTDHVCKNKNETDKLIINAYMELVKSANSLSHVSEEYQTIYRKDYFVETSRNFERIKRQKGLFLFMGNLTDEELLSGLSHEHSEKVSHKLNETRGRGNQYRGYIGVLHISPYYIEDIRNKLEQTDHYRISYLMAEEKTNGPVNR